jgi:glycosyltransferase involved in cell wall biosynthesis
LTDAVISSDGPSIILAANSAWNILNFRMNLIRCLRSMGTQPIAFVPPGGAGELRDAGVPVVTIPMKPTGTSPISDLMLFHRYRSALRLARPAAFLGFTAKPNIYGSLAAASLGIPTINNITGLGTAFIHGGLLDVIASRLYRLALARSAHVLFHNSDDLRLFVERQLVEPSRAAVIPGSGVDLDRFQPLPLPGDAERATFLFIGRLLWEKGVGEFTQAATAVKAKFPETRFQLLGSMDTSGRGVSPAQLAALMAEANVEYLGTRADVRPAIAAADCVVLPSYREGMPRVLLESAAMGRPLIATNTPGCRHVVDEGVTGFLCAVRSADALANAMIKMVEAAPEARSEMGRAARSLVQRHFSEAAVEQAYAERLQPLLNRSGSRRV